MGNYCQRASGTAICLVGSLVELSFKGQPLSYVSPVKLSVQVKVMQTASAWSPKLYIPSTINTQTNLDLLLFCGCTEISSNGTVPYF